MTEEGLIKQSIMQWLRLQRRCYPRVISLGGIGGRKNPSKGISDILVCLCGRFIAIEVKTRSGKLSEEQEEFLRGVQSAGGIAIVARSLDDVIRELTPLING